MRSCHSEASLEGGLGACRGRLNADDAGRQGAFNSYKGILKIGVDQNGVSLAIIRPFSFFYFCEPLFIPYSEIKGWQQQWYLDSKSVELEFARVPEVKMVMPADQVEWMRKRSGLQMTVLANPRRIGTSRHSGIIS
jgi:hypothetical protein